MTKAYLNLCLDIRAKFPIGVGVEIHGESGPHLTVEYSKYRWVELAQAEGKDYGDAKIRLEKLLQHGCQFGIFEHLYFKRT